MKGAFLGYSDRISVLPGETVEFRLSTELARFDATLVELRGAELQEECQQLETHPVEGAPTTSCRGRRQPLRPGSYGRVDDDSRLALGEQGSIRVFVMPTLVGDGRRAAILSRWDEAAEIGWWLGIDHDVAALRLADGRGSSEARASLPVVAHSWYCVAAAWDVATGSAQIAITNVVSATNSRRSPLCDNPDTQVGRGPALAAGRASAPTCVAAHWHSHHAGPVAHFNGKIERPTIWAKALDVIALSRSQPDQDAGAGPIADWDFAAAIGERGVASDRCEDLGPERLHLRLLGQPTRAVTGVSWTGEAHDFRRAPDQYGAIHFHDDDIDDVGWETDVRLRVPGSARSGLYALHVRAGCKEDYFPIWVRPRPEAEHAPILLLFPTATYMAYANDREGVEGDIAEAIVAHTYVITQMDVTVAETPGLGFSLYDAHADGSGIGYSSRLRPIPNIRPHHRHPNGSVWGLAADMHIVGWLNHLAMSFDVATDEDLEREGAELLERYKVVLTGTHPEYCSATSLDAFELFLGAGGRVMYLGGNGFYWVATPHPEKPHLLEVRRGTSGTRAWESAPGELHHAFTGEMGGLWRHRGRSPQKLFGVGFAGEGFDRSAPYTTLADWSDPALAWAVEGIAELSELGDFGSVGGGAAGHELDRYDVRLGSPLETFVLATSAGRHSDNYTRAVEEVGINRGGLTGTEDPSIRADITFYWTRSGGAVFATGSIAWCGALSCNDYDNDVSRLSRNVLRRLLDR